MSLAKPTLAIISLRSNRGSRCLFFELASQQSMERFYLVDPFAVVGPLLHQILVDVGDGLRIRVDAHLVGKDVGEKGQLRVDKIGRHFRLDNGVASFNSPFLTDFRPLTGGYIVATICRAVSFGSWVSESRVIT